MKRTTRIALTAGFLLGPIPWATAETPNLISDQSFLQMIANVQTAAQSRPPLTIELKYVGRSKEHQAVIKHVYDLATLQVLPMLARQTGDWALVFDVDETVLSNYQYQERIAGCGFNPKIWDAWINERAGTALPPAKEFIDKVREFAKAHPQHRGTIVYITDRNDGQREATRDNLRAVGLYHDGDLLLTKKFTPRGETPDTKDLRRECVLRGNTGSDERCKDIPPSEIVATFGDSYRDHFEHYGAQVRGEGGRQFDRCVASFKCYVIPNPMYGQWDDQGAAGPYDRFVPPSQPEPAPAHCPAR